MLVAGAALDGVAFTASSVAELLGTLRVEVARGGPRQLAETWMCGPPAASTIRFYAVLVGACSFRDDSGPSLRLARGDLIVLLRAGEHILSPETSCGAAAIGGQRRAGPSTGGTAIDGATVFVGELALDSASHALLMRLLPDRVMVPAEASSVSPASAAAASGVERLAAPLGSTLSALAFACASSALGASALASRLGDALVLQVIQSHLAREGALPALLLACSDPRIGRALSLIHRSPEQPWTVEALAARANMSRSAFRIRFSSLVGEPPARYLTRWRMRAGIDCLCRGNAPLRDIATCVGYESEAAFSKVFKRWTGCAPGAYRQRVQALREPQHE